MRLVVVGVMGLDERAVAARMCFAIGVGCLDFDRVRLAMGVAWVVCRRDDCGGEALLSWWEGSHNMSRWCCEL